MSVSKAELLALKLQMFIASQLLVLNARTLAEAGQMGVMHQIHDTFQAELLGIIADGQ